MDGYGTCQDGTFPNKGLKPFSGAWLLLREALGSLGAGTSSPSEHSLPGRFSARFFQPCLLNCSPSGPSLHAAWTPSLCPAQTTGWVSISLPSSIAGGSTAEANRSPRLGAGPCPGRFPAWPSPPGCRATSLWCPRAAIVPFTLAKPIPQDLGPSGHICCPTGPDCP